MRTSTLSITTAAAFLFLAVAAQAQDEAGCEHARYKAAGKYENCEAKSAGNGFNPGGFENCRRKYAGTWTRLGTKYPGTLCSVARFVDNGDGTVSDKLTRLVWEKKDSADGVVNLANRHDADNLYTWSAVDQDADGAVFTDFLANLNSTGFAGQYDWRLPTFFELQSILPAVSPCVASPCVADPLFLPTQSSVYWSSSTTDGIDPTYAWCVDFSNASTLAGSKPFSSYHVRAVRAGY